MGDKDCRMRTVGALEQTPDWFGPFISEELRQFIRANLGTFLTPSYPAGLTVEDLLAPPPVARRGDGPDLENLVPFGE